MNEHPVLLASYVILLLLVGFALLLAPRRVQRLAERSLRAGLPGGSDILVSFISSGRFLWNARFTGVIALLMALFLIWATLNS